MAPFIDPPPPRSMAHCQNSGVARMGDPGHTHISAPRISTKTQPAFRRAQISLTLFRGFLVAGTPEGSGRGWGDPYLQFFCNFRIFPQSSTTFPQCPHFFGFFFCKFSFFQHEFEGAMSSSHSMNGSLSMKTQLSFMHLCAVFSQFW